MLRLSAFSRNVWVSRPQRMVGLLFLSEGYFFKNCMIDTTRVRVATARNNISYKLMASPP